MRANTVYLEARLRTQELLNIKWTLRSAGYRIGSTWHEDEPTNLLACNGHWNVMSVAQLQACELLVVVCGRNEAATPEMAMMTGFALARGLRVIWIGSEVRGLSDFRGVEQFDTADDFLQQVLKQMYSNVASADQRLAA
jgi:hypothetical protein